MEQKENKMPTSHEVDSQESRVPDSGNLVHVWKDYEYVQFERGLRWYVGGIAVFALMMVTAFLMKSIMMAATFVLIAVLTIVYLRREPRVVDFKLFERGIEADGIFYDYRDLKSFWIFIGGNHAPFISIQRTKKYLPYIYIPLGQEDPSLIGEILKRFVPEKKQEERFSDFLERALKL